MASRLAGGGGGGGGPGEVKRLASEVEALRAENRRLAGQVRGGSGN